MKDIFIFGCARTGKTTLAKELYKELGYSIIPIDAFVDAFEKGLPSVGIGHSNTEVKFENLPVFVAKFYEKIKKDYPNVNFVIEGWHVFPKEIFKYLDIKNFVTICLGFPNQDIEKKIQDLRKYSYDGDYCQRMSDERLQKLVENQKTFSKKLQIECEEVGIKFFDLSQGWETTQEEIRHYIRNKI